MFIVGAWFVRDAQPKRHMLSLQEIQPMLVEKFSICDQALDPLTWKHLEKTVHEPYVLGR